MAVSFSSLYRPPDHQSGLAFKGSKVTLSWIAAAPVTPFRGVYLPTSGRFTPSLPALKVSNPPFSRRSLLPIASIVAAVTIIYGRAAYVIGQVDVVEPNGLTFRRRVFSHQKQWGFDGR